MAFYQRAEAEKKRLEDENKAIRKKLESAPEGVLRCRKERGFYKWFLSIEDANGNASCRYLSKKNRESARKLAFKTYYVNRLDDNEKEVKAIDAYLKRHKKEEDKASALKKHPAFAELLGTRDIDRELAAWKEERYEKNEQYTEHLNIRAVNGTMVRSKSEAYILSALEARGIAYRYECKLTLGRVALYPDFTIRRPGTGEMILWEHFGMMSDAAYAKNAQDKIRKYMQHGYYPMKNLITTFEEEGKPLDFSLVMDIVEWL